MWQQEVGGEGARELPVGELLLHYQPRWQAAALNPGFKVFTKPTLFIKLFWNVCFQPRRCWRCRSKWQTFQIELEDLETSPRSWKQLLSSSAHLISLSPPINIFKWNIPKPAAKLPKISLHSNTSNCKHDDCLNIFSLKTTKCWDWQRMNGERGQI